ncbi:hypothetical protein SESBI_31769 [Sesbania bispinosa]|nr:hypothetical protein SESBI_31769 [Sesbania bispinosa]
MAEATRNAQAMKEMEECLSSRLDNRLAELAGTMQRTIGESLKKTMDDLLQQHLHGFPGMHCHESRNSGGLKQDIQMLVRMFNPTSVQRAFQLARMYEAANAPTSLSNAKNVAGSSNNSGIVKNQKGLLGVKPVSAPKPIPSTSSQKETATSKFKTGKTLTPAFMSERRANGLCYFCDEPYSHEHSLTHKKLQLHVLEVLEDKETVEEPSVLAEFSDADELQISVHALSGVANFKTMRVTVRNFTWRLQNTIFTSDIMLIPLGGYDLVLGIEWLVTLGDIVWNFEKLHMEFKINGKRHVLRGSAQGGIKTIRKQQVGKVLADGVHLSMIHLCGGGEGLLQSLTAHANQPQLPPRIVDLLTEFDDGHENMVADALSRVEELECHSLSTYQLQSDLVDKIRATWLTDVSLRKLIKEIQEGSAVHKHYTWHNEELRRNGRLVVGNDSKLREELLQWLHSSGASGHSGINATMQRIKVVLHWKGLTTDVKRKMGSKKASNLMELIFAPLCTRDPPLSPSGRLETQHSSLPNHRPTWCLLAAPSTGPVFSSVQCSQSPFSTHHHRQQTPSTATSRRDSTTHVRWSAGYAPFDAQHNHLVPPLTKESGGWI